MTQRPRHASPARLLHAHALAIAPLAFAIACAGDDGATDSDSGASAPGFVTTVGSQSGTGTSAATGGGSGSASSNMTSGTSSAGGTSSATAPTSDPSDPSDSGPKLDVGAPDVDPTTGGAADGCTSVDLLFVIDNSVSMGDYQNALGLAFPGFTDAIIESLPPGTNLHVGVTSTTMGYSSGGATLNCIATGDDNLPQEAFYETPDMSDNGINGAQGRLYDPGGGVYYYDIDTDAGPAELQGLKDWFADAAKVGTGGSQIEMATAPVGWVADPANSATNEGFIRDEGAVLVLFFMQDESDQTPYVIEGQNGGDHIRQRIALAKAGCGGTDCIIGGGFLNQFCYEQAPISDLLENIGAPPVVTELPDDNLAEDNPAQAAEEMNQLLRDTLAGVIAEKCDEIPPPQ